MVRDTDARAEVGCDLASNTCATPNVEVAPGGTCDPQTHFCAQGSCYEATSDATSGVCPTIIADGQPCDSSSLYGASQCEYESQCINNVCVFPSPASCK